MSTRCNIHFGYDSAIYANVYRHSDGYPSGVLPDLQQFFLDVKEQCGGDTRFDDPEYLAAKYIVWQAGQYGRNGAPLRFTGVSPSIRDHGDIEYIYKVNCSMRGQLPEVVWQRPGEVIWHTEAETTD